jgi:hypothetical protein
MTEVKQSPRVCAQRTAAEHLTRASVIAAELEAFAPGPSIRHKGGSQAYVRRQAARLQRELKAAALALGLKVDT